MAFQPVHIPTFSAKGPSAAKSKSDIVRKRIGFIRNTKFPQSFTPTLFHLSDSTKKPVEVKFTSEQISHDGGLLLLNEVEKQLGLIEKLASCINDPRHQSYVLHGTRSMIKQRVMQIAAGYEDANDVHYLKNDPIIRSILGGDLASQPTVSRFENAIDKRTIFSILYGWLNRYVQSLSGREQVIIDIDATDDPTHGDQQLSMYNGYYGQFMYNELLFHDGETGQIILPVFKAGEQSFQQVVCIHFEKSCAGY